MLPVQFCRAKLNTVSTVAENHKHVFEWNGIANEVAYMLSTPAVNLEAIYTNTTVINLLPML